LFSFTQLNINKKMSFDKFLVLVFADPDHDLVKDARGSKAHNVEGYNLEIKFRIEDFLQKISDACEDDPQRRMVLVHVSKWTDNHINDAFALRTGTYPEYRVSGSIVHNNITMAVLNQLCNKYMNLWISPIVETINEGNINEAPIYKMTEEERVNALFDAPSFGNFLRFENLYNPN